MSKKPNHQSEYQEMDELMECLMELCDGDMTIFQMSKCIRVKLKKLAEIFENCNDEDVIQISPYGYIHRIIAIQNGYFRQSSAKEVADAEESVNQFSNEAESIIDWLSGTSDDDLPSEELEGEAVTTFKDPSSIDSAKQALGEIFEIVNGKTRLRERVMLAIREKIVEKTGKKIPEESREAVELALQSSHPFSDKSMKTALLRDGGDAIKRHPDGVVAPSADAMKHILAKILFTGPRGKEGYSDNACNQHEQAQ